MRLKLNMYSAMVLKVPVHNGELQTTVYYQGFGALGFWGCGVLGFWGFVEGYSRKFGQHLLRGFHGENSSTSS